MIKLIQARGHAEVTYDNKPPRDAVVTETKLYLFGVLIYCSRIEI